MKKLLVLIIALLLTAGLYAQTNHHVTTAATGGGDGSLGDPWTFVEAFAQGNANSFSGGDTLFIHEGYYYDRGFVWFSGDSNADVVITNVGQVTIDANVAESYGNINANMYVSGDYITIEGFIFDNTNVTRTTTAIGSAPPFPQTTAGVFLSSLTNYVTIKNNIIKNAHSSGILAYGTNNEIYGNVLYYNGWENEAGNPYTHGIYAHNSDTTSYLRIHNNIIFSSFAFDLHIYGTAIDKITNIHLDKNILFKAGEPAVREGYKEILLGGLAPTTNSTVNYNSIYNEFDRGGGIALGYYDEANDNNEVAYNYIAKSNEMLAVNYQSNANIHHNFMYDDATYYGILLDITGGTRASLDFNYNDYWYLGTRDDYLGGGTWAEWQTEGFDANGSYTTSAPTGFHIQLYDTLDMSWVNMAIYDWDKIGTASVDLSSVLEIGADYYIYDVQNLTGGAVVSGTYSGGSVNVPTNLSMIETMVGNDIPTTPVHTDSEFNAYIIQSSAFISPPTASFTATPNPAETNETITFDGSASTDNGTIVSYDWTFGDGNTDTGITTTHSYSTADTYTAWLKVTDNEANVDSTSRSITINQAPIRGITTIAELDAAQATAGGGDTLKLAANSFVGDITIYADGDNGNPLVIIAEDGYVPVFSDNITLTGNYVKFESVSFSGNLSLSEPTAPSIVYCSFTGTGEKITITFPSNDWEGNLWTIDHNDYTNMSSGGTIDGHRKSIWRALYKGKFDNNSSF